MKLSENKTVFPSELRYVFSKKTKNKVHLDTDCSVAFHTQTEQRGKGVWVGVLNILRGQKQNHIILPKKYKFSQNFDAKSPKKHEIARKFAGTFDTLNQAGGGSASWPPTSYATTLY